MPRQDSISLEEFVGRRGFGLCPLGRAEVLPDIPDPTQTSGAQF